MSFHSVEFYIILTVVAAAIIAVLARPSRRSAARSFLIPGQLLTSPTSSEPMVSVTVDDHANVHFLRTGICEITSSATLTLSATLIDHDLTLKQCVASGYANDPTVTAADYLIDFLGRDRYHIHYHDETTNLSCSFSLTVRPGISMQLALKH